MQVNSVESLQAYLLQTSQAVRKRSVEAANALQQLAADLSDGGPKAAKLAEQLNATQASFKASEAQVEQLKSQLATLQQQVEAQKGTLDKQKQLIQAHLKQEPKPGGSEADRLHVLEVAGLQCNAVHDQEVRVAVVCRRHAVLLAARKALQHRVAAQELCLVGAAYTCLRGTLQASMISSATACSVAGVDAPPFAPAGICIRTPTAYAR